VYGNILYHHLSFINKKLVYLNKLLLFIFYFDTRKDTRKFKENKKAQNSQGRINLVCFGLHQTFSISYSIRKTSPLAIKGRCLPLGKIKACFLLINNRSHSPSVITSMGPFFGKSAAFSSRSIPG
jgi:hypothetical protein